MKERPAINEHLRKSAQQRFRVAQKVADLPIALFEEFPRGCLHLLVSLFKDQESALGTKTILDGGRPMTSCPARPAREMSTLARIEALEQHVLLEDST